jgi:hypothetical protein
VTMDLPSASKPKPTKIEITDRGARLLTVSATVGAASIVSTPARGVVWASTRGGPVSDRPLHRRMI